MNEYDSASQNKNSSFNEVTSSTGSAELLSEIAKNKTKTYLTGLNEKQCQAVETLDGPVLVLSGAGTGKTRALTARIAHILNTGKARPHEILAVTFTNKAAREMKSRVTGYVGSVVEGMPWLGTFHSICVKLLRRHAELVDLSSDFTILDTDDQLRLLKQLIRAENIDERTWPPKLLLSIIDRWKNRALSPENLPSTEETHFNSRGPELYKKYQVRLTQINAADFGDLLLHVVTLFQKSSEILRKYQTTFKYILVDEYQDTNVAQYLWLRLLAEKYQNICCVGDDDQSIYGWRGAEVGNILRFEKDFPAATIIKLEQNYRSTPHILSTASILIEANKSRLAKTLWTEIKSGEKVKLIGHWDGEEEARWIGEQIESINYEKEDHKCLSFGDQAILVRASFQMRAFEDRFLAIGIPYKVIGGPRFYERQEIKDAIAYFRLAVSLKDDLAMERIINVPKRGIGEKALQTLTIRAREREISLFESAQVLINENSLQSKAKGELTTLVKQLLSWKEFYKKKEIKHYELAGLILDESGYTDMLKNEKSITAPGRLENLKELVKALEEFENLEGFLEHISLVMENEQDENTPKVSIMTLHGAKGLEFESVFLPGWEDGLFPSQRSMDESGKIGLEEERRLAYVGITRAKKICTISFANNRRVYNQWQSSIPSRFINELSTKDVEILTPDSDYGRDFQASRYGNEAETERLQPMSRRIFSNEPKNNYTTYSTPGWKRLQQSSNSGTHRLPKIIKNQSLENTTKCFEEGQMVFHQKFGYGEITELTGDTASISFKKAGKKRVKISFLVDAKDI